LLEDIFIVRLKNVAKKKEQLDKILYIHKAENFQQNVYFLFFIFFLRHSLNSAASIFFTGADLDKKTNKKTKKKTTIVRHPLNLV
jgi:hypothetical protein